MKIAIVGFGKEGRAAYDYWRDSNDITICDQKNEIEAPEGVTTQLGDEYLANLDVFDLVVRSPFVRPDALKVSAEKITSNTNEFIKICPTRNIIGITGTKGKGTTSSLIAKLLEAAGKTVHLGGNIGVAALELLKNDIKPDDWVVLELSSFQLIDLQQSPAIAACLMIAPEHLDWHKDVNEYYTAKQQLFSHQTEEDVAVYFAGNEQSQQIASAGAAVKIPYFATPGALIVDGTVTINDQIICRTNELKLVGAHNWQNVCAAITTVWGITQDVEPIRQVLTNFQGLPYRLEPVATVGGVTYYNDSFGTTPETASVAVQAFAQPKVLILGGSDKGADYASLAQVVASATMRKVLVIGDQAARITTALTTAGFTDIIPGGDSMPAIVETARSVSEPGDVVLLSPACASFGMFKDYKDRGNQFTAAVQSLAATA